MVVTPPRVQYPGGGRDGKASLVVDEGALDELLMRPSGPLGAHEQELEELCSNGVPLSESEASD